MDKRCTKCGVVKPPDAFRERWRNGFVYSARRCRECENEDQRERRRLAHPPKPPRPDCVGCGRNVPEVSFHKPRAERCTECRRQLLRTQDRRYRALGLSPERLAALMDLPCSVCERVHGDGVRGTVHFNSSGRWLATICRQCARGMALLGDDPELLGRAKAFLESRSA